MNRILSVRPSRLWEECLSSTDPATVAKDDKKGPAWPQKKHFPTTCVVSERRTASRVPLRKWLCIYGLVYPLNDLNGGGQKSFSKNQVHPGNEQLEPRSHLFEKENHLHFLGTTCRSNTVHLEEMWLVSIEWIFTGGFNDPKKKQTRQPSAFDSWMIFDSAPNFWHAFFKASKPCQNSGEAATGAWLVVYRCPPFPGC